MSERTLCKRCGTELPADSAGSGCPVCLLGLALEDTGGAATEATPPGSSGPEELGSVGPYKLLSILGEGGMGTVYLAEQSAPIWRRVALKVIKRGMDTKEVIARFESERQALALMSHRNVARVLDAGTTKDGLPYFVMEHVAGVPITEYCDNNRLDSRQRLELFSEVCQAVQHAHQKGIIHRDIKPSNVLVSEEDGKPRPRIIDFGVAKAINQRLTEKTLFTQRGVVVGTPGYMSPEQADPTALDVDIRTDIYSLGVLLYELVAGVPPFDPKRLLSAGWGEMQRIIREEEPPKPSTRVSRLGGTATGIADKRRTTPGTLERDLRGDLDWITLKALEKDRVRRYQSATEFSADVGHYLAGEPVVATPPSARYRISKFVRRHRVGVGAVAAVFAALLLGLVATALQYRQAEGARRENRRQLVRLSVERGMQLADQGDYLGGVPWLVRALRLEEGGPPAQAIHRLRIASVLELCPRLVALYPHRQSIASVTQSKSGRLVATASQDATARVWQTADGAPRTPPLPHPAGVRDVAFSPDEQRIATACDDGRARIWSVGESTQPIAELVHDGQVFGVAFSQDGAILATASEDGKARLFDAASGELLATLAHDGPVMSIDFSPDGRMLATGSLDGSARVWDVRRPGIPARRFDNPNGVDNVGFSPDGSRLAAAGAFGIFVWNLATGLPVRIELADENELSSAVFNPDGTLLVTASHGTVKLWDAVSGAEKMILPGLGGMAIVAAFTPDGRRLALGSVDGRVYFWETRRGTQIPPVIRHGGMVTGIVFDEAGRHLVTSSADGMARRWDLATTVPPGPVLRHEGPVYDARFSPDGRHLVTGSAARFFQAGYARVWDVETFEPATPPMRQQGTIVFGLAISKDGRKLASGSRDGTLRVWDSTSGEPLVPPVRFPGWVRTVAFGPQDADVLAASTAAMSASDNAVWGEAELRRVRVAPDRTGDISIPGVSDLALRPNLLQVAGATPEGTIRLYDTATGRPVGPDARHSAQVNINSDLSRGALSQIGFSPDGRLLFSVSEFEGIRLWHADALGKPPVAIPAAGILHLAFHPESDRFAFGTSGGAVEVRRAFDGSPVVSPLQHEGVIADLSFSPNGRLLVSASQNGNVRLWDTESGLPVTPELRRQGAVHMATFSPDGRRLATAEQNFAARIWLLPSEERDQADLEVVAELLSGTHFDGSGASVPISSKDVVERWETLRGRHPETAAAAPSVLLAWHTSRAVELQWTSAQGAEAALDRAIELQPRSAALLAWRGELRARQGRWEPAATDFSQAANLRPDDASYAASLAFTHLASGERPEAERVCAGLIDRFRTSENPDTAGWTAAPCVYVTGLQSGDASALVELARAALVGDPTNPQSLELLGHALFRAGRREEAAQAIDEALAAEPEQGWNRVALLRALIVRAGGRSKSRGTAAPGLPANWIEGVEKTLLEQELGGARGSTNFPRPKPLG